MVFRTIILAFTTLAAVLACDRSTWPPNHAQMARIFEQQKATFVKLEQEMAVMQSEVEALQRHMERIEGALFDDGGLLTEVARLRLQARAMTWLMAIAAAASLTYLFRVAMGLAE